MSDTLKPNGQGLERLIKASDCSRKGLVAAFKYESAFRQELMLGCVLIPIAWFTTETLMQFALLAACYLLILIVELLNSAVEATVDRISTEHNKLAGRAKDLGSAAVAIALLLLVLVWTAHFVDYFS